MQVLAEGSGERIGWHDPDENREWVRDNKSRELKDKRMTMADAVSRYVFDGALLASGGFGHVRVSMAAIYEIIRQQKKHLTLAGKTAVHDADILIGAGCVAELETSAVSLGEAGFAPRFSAALREGRIILRDATCPAIHSMLQASEKGIPFMPLRGIIGSDILANRPDWKVVPNPFAEDGEDPIVLLPARRPDFAIFHAAMADSEGNVWLGRRRECATIAHASKAALVTVERFVEGNFLENEKLAPGAINSTYITATAIAERGAHPVALLDEYGFDAAYVSDYARAAKTEDGFRAWLDREVFGAAQKVAAE